MASLNVGTEEGENLGLFDCGGGEDAGAGRASGNFGDGEPVGGGEGGGRV
jgi:hypothetical protein